MRVRNIKEKLENICLHLLSLIILFSENVPAKEINFVKYILKNHPNLNSQ